MSHDRSNKKNSPVEFKKQLFRFATIFMTIALFGGTSGAEQAPQSQTDTHAKSASSRPAFTLEPLLDHPVILKGSSDPVYLLLRFDAPEIPVEQRTDRPPLNLSLVLDRSGSMEDKGKMEYLKTAAKFAVDRLESTDHLSIVEYDDQITLLLKAQPVTDKDYIKSLIQGLFPRDSTNLTGGMMRGVEEVKREQSKFDNSDILNRVLLLSDGLANTGVTDPSEIKQLVKQAKADGVRISAMGLGRDYDEDLMQMIAEHAGGNYYYIEHPNQMARIFEQELETLFATVAKDPKLTIEIGQKWNSAELLSSDETEVIKSVDGKLTMDLDNIYAGEKRSYLLRLDPKENALANNTDNLTIANITVSYFDIETGTQNSMSAIANASVVTDQAAVDQAANNDVIVEANLIETEQAHAQVISTYESGKYDEALQLMTDLEAKVTNVNAELNDARLKSKAEALNVEKKQMSDSMTSEAERSHYLKNTKQRLYQSKSGKRALYQLQLGDKGYEVERLQNALKDNGYYNGPIDGNYSEEVKAAVEKLQADNNLAVDGVAGPATQEKVSNY